MSGGKVEIAGHDGSVRVRSLEPFQAKQKIPYYLGVSGKTSGAEHLSLNLVVVPPHASAEAHTHSGFESAVYVISGRAVHHWGEGPRVHARDRTRRLPLHRAGRPALSREPPRRAVRRGGRA